MPEGKCAILDGLSEVEYTEFHQMVQTIFSERGPAMTMSTEALNIRLPWPPSINNYWRANGRMRFISKAGRIFRDEVIATVRPDKPLTGRLSVYIEAIPPTARSYDLDNLLKPTLDALQHAGVFENDNQIDQLRIDRRPKSHPGCLDVSIFQLTES